MNLAAHTFVNGFYDFYCIVGKAAFFTHSEWPGHWFTIQHIAHSEKVCSLISRYHKQQGYFAFRKLWRQLRRLDIFKKSRIGRNNLP